MIEVSQVYRLSDWSFKEYLGPEINVRVSRGEREHWPGTRWSFRGRVRRRIFGCVSELKTAPLPWFGGRSLNADGLVCFPLYTSVLVGNTISPLAFGRNLRKIPLVDGRGSPNFPRTDRRVLDA